MTIDEAIKHCEEVAEQNETKALRIGWQYEGTLLDREAKECRRCAADHRQLAEWLTELKHLRDEVHRMKPDLSMASVPTADVRPVTYGHWIEDHCDLICSNCQTHFKDEIVCMCYDWSNYPPFCPNCAADMRNRLIETEVEGLYLNIEE